MTAFDPADTLSGATAHLPAIPAQEWDPPTLSYLAGDGEPLTDLRHEHYTEQVVAALHGDPRVFDLDPGDQEDIANVARVFERIAAGILADHDPRAITRRAAVLLTADPEGAATYAERVEEFYTWETAEGLRLDGDHKTALPSYTGGTPMRCPACDRIHGTVRLSGDIEWEVAGREDIACPPCWKAQPRHATKAAAPAVKAKATAAAGTRRRRPSQARSQARKAAGGGTP